MGIKKKGGGLSKSLPMSGTMNGETELQKRCRHSGIVLQKYRHRKSQSVKGQ